MVSRQKENRLNEIQKKKIPEIQKRAGLHQNLDLVQKDYEIEKDGLNKPAEKELLQVTCEQGHYHTSLYEKIQTKTFHEEEALLDLPYDV